MYNFATVRSFIVIIEIRINKRIQNVISSPAHLFLDWVDQNTIIGSINLISKL